MSEKIRVVIADDEIETLNGIATMVELAGGDFEIIGCASDGDAAYELCSALHPNLLLTDVRMPGMDGIELTKKLADNGLDITAIIISAYDDKNYLQHAIRSPVIFDYILKPFHYSEFCELINSAKTFILNKQNAGKKENQFAGVVSRLSEMIMQDKAGEAVACAQAFLGGVAPDSLRDTCSELLMRLEWNARSSDDFKSSFQLFDYLKKLCDAQNAEEMLSCIVSYIKHKCRKGTDAARITTLVASCLKLISEHYSEKYFGLPEASGMLGITPNYLGSRFSRDVGMSFTRYLTRFRLEKAKEYLADPKYKISQVSDMVGFADHGYFDRVFKEYIGLTPSEYRSSFYAQL